MRFALAWLILRAVTVMHALWGITFGNLDVGMHKLLCMNAACQRTWLTFPGEWNAAVASIRNILKRVPNAPDVVHRAVPKLFDDRNGRS